MRPIAVVLCEEVRLAIAVRWEMLASFSSIKVRGIAQRSGLFGSHFCSRVDAYDFFP